MLKLKKILALAPFLVFSAHSSAVRSAEPLRVGIVLDKGGKDDKSFNSSAYLGAKQAEKDLKIQLKVVESSDDNAFEPMLRSFSQKKFDLVIGIGFSQAESLKKVAALFPEQKYAIVDAEVASPNVKSLMFEEQEGSYLVGAIAALKSKSKTIGFIGGMDIPLIRRFQLGFEEGVKHVNPQAKVKAGYIGVTSESWNNPPKAKELALSQYKSGCDVIFVAAGASNAGAFDAAEEKKFFAIGVDSNQNWVKPGRILTSMLKRVDLAVYGAIKELVDGKFTTGTTRYGLKSDGVGFSLDEYNKPLLTPDDLKTLEKIKSDIVSGNIVVSDYYKKPKK